MRRPTVLLCLALIAAFLIFLTGCNPAPDPTQPGTTLTGPSTPSTPSSIPDPSGDPIDQTTTPTGPTDPLPEVADIQHLRSTVYVTNIFTPDGRLGTPTAEELELTITRYVDGQEAVSVDMTHIEDLFYYETNFQDPRNRFTLQRIDPELPIYFIDAAVYLTASNGSYDCSFFIDLDKEWMIFVPNVVPTRAYTVAAADPAADPYMIAEFFLPYLEERFPPWEGMEETMYPIPERIEQHFCYELTGTWLDADGQLLDTMDFRLIGNLTPEGGFNDDVERNLTLLWPDSFGYENAEPVSKSIILTLQESGPNYHGVGLLEHRQSGELVTYWFNIFPEDEVVIIGMDDHFLVSSTHSDADAAAILSQYRARLISHNAQTVDWAMTAYLLTADSAVSSTATISIRGYIQEHTELYSCMVLDIDLPEGFRYFYSLPGPYGNFGYRVLTDAPNEYTVSGSFYDSLLNHFAHGYWAINTEKEYFVGHWEDEHIPYMVACTDPSVTAQEIMDHFRNYLEQHRYND